MVPANNSAGSRRFGLVGARRARQGLGPFMARFVEDAGARLEAFCGRGPGRLPRTAHDLQQLLGHPVRGYDSVEAMIAGERARGAALESLIIASPTENHPSALAAALAAGIDVLCEKPLLWNGAGSAEQAATLIEAFEAAGLRLWVNTQWPYTLRAYRELFPELDLARPVRFDMRLAPISSGDSMLTDSLPHPLSLLQTVAPAESAAGLSNPHIELLAPDARQLRCTFDWCGSRELRCEILLAQQPQAPRPASYGFDGRIAERSLRMPDYEISFCCGERRVPVADPVGELVRDFCLGRTAPHPIRMGRLEVQRLLALEAVMAAFPQ